MTNKNILILGSGFFSQAFMQVLKNDNNNVYGCFTNKNDHYGSLQHGQCFNFTNKKNLKQFIAKHNIQFIIPMSINWKDYLDDIFLKNKDIEVFSVNSEALKIEADRMHAIDLCHSLDIPTMKSMAFNNKEEAIKYVKKTKAPFVIKNKNCSPKSKIKTMVCTTFEETLFCLNRINCTEEIFLQMYSNGLEAGHVAFVVDDKIYPIANNQEYKKLYAGNLGVTLSSPMGCLVEFDQQDLYQFTKIFLSPLKSWFKQVNYRGPIQVTVIKHKGTWKLLEFNARLGVSSGPLIIQNLNNPLKTLKNILNGDIPNIQIKKNIKYSMSSSIVAYNYPNTNQSVHYPIKLKQNHKKSYILRNAFLKKNTLFTHEGSKFMDVIAHSNNLKDCIHSLQHNLSKVSCYGSFYRTDIGQTLWPLC